MDDSRTDEALNHGPAMARSNFMFAVFSFMLVAAGYYLGAMILAFITASLGMPERMGLVTTVALAQLGVMLPLTLFGAKVHPLPRLKLFSFARPSLATIAFALLLWAGLMPMLQVVLAVQDIAVLQTSWADSYVESRMFAASVADVLIVGDTWPALLVTVFVVGLVPAFCEEMFMRGLVQGSFEATLRPSAAIALSAALFAALHLLPVLFLPLACVGLLLGYLAWRTQNLVVPMVVHAVHNLLMVAVSVTATGAPGPRDAWQTLPPVALLSLPGAVAVWIAVRALNRRHSPGSSSNISPS